MIIDDCKVLVSNDVPPRVLIDPILNKVLMACGGVCCLGYSCNTGYDQSTCELIGGRWVPGVSDCGSYGATGFGPCDCPCRNPGTNYIRPACYVSASWTFSTTCIDPYDTTESGSFAFEPLETPACPDPYFNVDNGFYSTCWYYATGFPSCDVSFGQSLGEGFGSCPGASFDLIKYCPDNWCGSFPAGWYIAVSFCFNCDFGEGFVLNCAEGSFEPPGGSGCSWCAYLGADDTIFAADVPFSIVFTGVWSTVNITGIFHPCP